MALSTVYPPEDSNALSTVDLVAVHGLGGDAVDTWTHPKSNAFWLKDFLPQQIPDARVMTFGYNAAAAFGQSTAEVIDHAKGLLSSLIDKRDEPEEKDRPLIFVAHSLGGIVVKQALFQARVEPRYKSICDATQGILFFGTPHRGSEKAVYGKVLSNVAQTLAHRPSSRLVSALQMNSDVLLRLTSDFRFQLPQYHVFSFYEQRPMKIFSSLIVEKHSALLEIEQEEQIPVDANHSMICKFETDRDDTLEKVCKRIKRMRKGKETKAIEQTVSYNQHFEVPHLLSPAFTGRDKVGQQLESSLALAKSPQRSVQRRFVLWGLGGAGKTQICLKYLQTYRERYWAIFWIDASNVDSIRQGFKQIAVILQVETDVESVKRVLANTSKTWLLVFDNADDPDLSLNPYFPTGDRGDLIITSRNPKCQRYNTVGWQEVGRLSHKDSEALLRKTAYSDTVPADHVKKESQKIQQVVEALGYLALAIVQAGAYIQETLCTLEEYLELYQRRQKEILGHLPTHSGTDYRYTVYTTWQVSLDKIASMQGATPKHALDLLSFLCFYHHEQIPRIMFENAWRNSQTNLAASSSWMWPAVIPDFLDYRQAVSASVTLLASFSLISQDSEASLSLHPLVHDWCQVRMSAVEQQDGCQRAFSLLLGSVNWEFETEDYSFRRSLASHVHACLSTYDRQHNDKEDKTAQEWSKIALILGENGPTWKAMLLSNQVVPLSKSKLGEHHPDTLRSIGNLGNWYYEVGRRDKTLQLSEQVVALIKSKLGEHHPYTLAAMQNLTFCYSKAGRHDEALQLAEQVLPLFKSNMGEHHIETVGSMYSLALVYSEVGRQKEALQLAEQVVPLFKSKLGEDHPATLFSIELLAYISAKMSKDVQNSGSAHQKRDGLSKLWQKLRI